MVHGPGARADKHDASILREKRHDALTKLRRPKTVDLDRQAGLLHAKDIAVVGETCVVDDGAWVVNKIITFSIKNNSNTRLEWQKTMKWQ